MADESLYDRLGGIFDIAEIIDEFSNSLINNPIVGKRSSNPRLRAWHTRNLNRLAGLKFMRTLWVADVTGGPFDFSATRPGTTDLGLEEAHRALRISPAEFDEVASVLAHTLNRLGIRKRERDEVLAAFAAHKAEVTAGHRDRRVD